MVLKISNKDARTIWLNRQGLAVQPTGTASPDALLDIIRQIGFVQLDTIRIVARAHHHILWSRNQNYREHMLGELLTQKRAVFEHFTHDASVLPMEFYPVWRRQFRRLEAKLKKGNWGKALPPIKERAKIRKRIELEGALCTRDFTGKADKTKHPWMRPPHKFGLDYLWYAGDLTTCHRTNFIKYYDLAERIIPPHLFNDRRDDAEQIDWLCREALSRLGFGNERDIQRFWDAVDLAEVKNWTAATAKQLIPAEVTTADGGCISVLLPANFEEMMADARSPTSRLRIVNPFDPVVRDRERLQRLFGFDYRIEIFVPAANRQYGYYIYPILEGDRFIGRIEVRGDRKKSTLTVENLWLEPRVTFGKDRRRKLDGELERLSRFIRVATIIWGKSADQVVK